METVFVKCTCGSPDHVVMIVLDHEDKEAFIQVQLSQHNNFFKRIILAVKYIFGYKCQYGHWDETLLDQAKIKELRDVLSNFLGDNG